MSVCNAPFAVISLLLKPDLCCPCLSWSCFLHDSTFLFDTPCLGKGSITTPTQADTSCKTSRELFRFRCWAWVILRACIFLSRLPAQWRENYRSGQRLGFKMNWQSLEKEDKKEGEIYFKVKDFIIRILKPGDFIWSLLLKVWSPDQQHQITWLPMINAKPHTLLKTH